MFTRDDEEDEYDDTEEEHEAEDCVDSEMSRVRGHHKPGSLPFKELGSAPS